MELESVKVESETPPQLDGSWVFNYYENQFQSPILPKLTIYVPSESVEAYKEASIWLNYADKIQAIQ
jgi:hypothetical protein